LTLSSNIKINLTAT